MDERMCGADRLARPLPVPVLAVGAEGGVGRALFESLRNSAVNIKGTVLTGCGHYLPDECPTEFTGAILSFWRNFPSHSDGP